MPELTRRRSLDAPDECWHVYRRFDRARTDAVGLETATAREWLIEAHCSWSPLSPFFASNSLSTKVYQTTALLD
jgi:hypothetical protein